MDDGNPGVRDAAFQGFAGLIVCLGKQAVNEFFQNLDKHKQKKIEEFMSNVVIPTPEVKLVASTAQVTPNQAPSSKAETKHESSRG